MPNPHSSLPPAAPDAVAGGMGTAGAWPVALAASAAALGLAGLAWQLPGADAGSHWMTALLGLVVFLPPLWLGHQLRRQARMLDAQAQRLQQQDADRQALARSAELLGQAEQVAQLGSFDWDPVTGALHWSDGHFRLWGHAPGALVPDYAAFRARIHPDDLGALEARLQHNLRAGGVYEFTHRVRWPDGTVLEVLARGEVTRNARGEAVRMIGTVQDITRRRAAEARLQMHEFLVNTITDPLSVIDENRTYLLVNQAWCRVTGIPAETATGRQHAALQAHVASTERDAALQRCLAGSPREVVLAALDMPGTGQGWWETTLFPFQDPHTGRRGAAVISRDVTTRVATERSLAASLDNLRMTLNATGDAIYASCALDPQAPLLFANDRLLDMWGIPPGQAGTLTAAGVMAVATPQFADPEAEVARVAEVIASGTLQEDRVALKDGRMLLRRCMPTQQAGRPVCVWGLRDITVEWRAQGSLRAAEAQQRALLAAFPGPIACIDANLRYTHVTPRLAALLGSTPQALVGRSVADVAGPQRAPQLLHRVARAMDGEVQCFERVHPARDGQPAVHMLVTLARAVDRQTGQVQCHAFGMDVSALKQSEAALLAAKNEAERANAAKSAALSRLSQALRAPADAVLGAAAQLRDDTLAPLAPHQQAQLRDILENGARLRALSDDLLGLAHTDVDRRPVPPPLVIPPHSPLPSLLPSLLPTDGARSPLQVLYIDDNPVNALLMVAMFERLPGLALRCESDPRAGVAQAQADPPALLLVDIQMPVIDGFEVLRQVRAHPATQAVPAIAVSANAMPQDLARGHEAGFADYLTKPLALHRLQTALQAALPGWVGGPIPPV